MVATNSWGRRSIIVRCDTVALRAFDYVARDREGSVVKSYRAALADESSRRSGWMKRIVIVEESDMSNYIGFLSGLWLFVGGLIFALNLLLFQLNVIASGPAIALSVLNAVPLALFAIHGIFDGFRFRARPNDAWDSYYSVGNVTFMTVWASIAIVLSWLYLA